MLVVCVFASALGGLIMCLLVLRDVFWPATAHAPRTELDLQVTKVGHVIAAACFAMTAVIAIILVARTPLRAAQPVAQPHVSVPDPRISERLAALERDRAALTEQVTALGGTMQTLREQVTATDSGVHGLRIRLDQAEGRMTSADAGLKRLSEEIAQTNARARQAERATATKPAVVAPREMVVPAAPPIPPPPPQRRTEVERPHESASSSTTPAAAPGPTTQIAPPPSAHVAPPPTAAPQPPVASTPPKPAPASSAKAATAKPAPSAAASAPQDAPPANITDKVRNDWSTIRRGFSTLGDDFSNAMRDFGRRATGRD
jgi:hypothetical protein